MSNEIGNLKEKYKDLLPIDNQDYKKAIDTTDAKNYYETYLRIFDGIIKCENEEQLKDLKKDIKKNNPWKKALTKELRKSNKYRSIADSDRSILELLIEEEINSFEDNNISEKTREFLNKELRKTYRPFDEKSKFNDVVENTIATIFFNQLFSDFEHVFDGNFENPRVVILGINPKLSDIEHKRFNLQRVYKNPFNSRRNTLFSNNDENDENDKNDKYYFGTDPKK